MTDTEFLQSMLYTAYMAGAISLGEVKEACERFAVPFPPMYNGKTPATLSHAPGLLTTNRKVLDDG